MIEKDVIVIGGGQAGLSMGYYLQKDQCDLLILDANARTGDNWRNHYDPSIYRNPTELHPGSVLVIGAGNSGAQIAVELAKQHEVTISVGHQMSFKPLYLLRKSIFWYFDKFGLLGADVNTKRASWLMKKPEQIYGLELKRLLYAKNVKMKPRAVSAEGETIRFEDGSSIQVNNVIWATGFQPNYSWVQIAGLLDSNGFPQHDKGVTRIPGLYVLGLPWQSRRGSALMGWVGQDAEYLMSDISKNNRLL